MRHTLGYLLAAAVVALVLSATVQAHPGPGGDHSRSGHADPADGSGSHHESSGGRQPGRSRQGDGQGGQTTTTTDTTRTNSTALTIRAAGANGAGGNSRTRSKRERHGHGHAGARRGKHGHAKTSTAPSTASTGPSTAATATAGLTTAAVTPAGSGSYPVHTNITATVFWVGEPKGNGSSENNAISAYDDAWEAHFGGYDNYTVTRVAPTYYNGIGFTPKENPFYLDLPFDDINNAAAYAHRASVVPWAKTAAGAACLAQGHACSLMKNHWVKLWRTVGGVTYTAYGQIEDAGPYVYDDEAYVFGSNDARPQSKQANNAGLDVSPALRDYLHFTGSSLADQQNGDSNKVSWQFVDASQVPAGPWKAIVTTRQVYQP